MEVAEAKARLTNQNDILKYQISEYKKERAEIDNEVNRLRHQRTTFQSKFQDTLKDYSRVKEELSSLRLESQNCHSTINKISDQNHQLILVVTKLHEDLDRERQRVTTLTKEYAVLQKSATNDLTPRFKEWEGTFRSLDISAREPGFSSQDKDCSKLSSKQCIEKLVQNYQKLKIQLNELRKRADKGYPEINLSVKKKSAKSMKVIEKAIPQGFRDAAAQLTGQLKHGRESKLLKMQTAFNTNRGNIKVISPPITPRGEGLSASVVQNSRNLTKQMLEDASVQDTLIDGAELRRYKPRDSINSPKRSPPLILESDTEELFLLARKTSVL